MCIRYFKDVSVQFWFFLSFASYKIIRYTEYTESKLFSVFILAHYHSWLTTLVMDKVILTIITHVVMRKKKTKPVHFHLMVRLLALKDNCLNILKQTTSVSI